MMKPTAELGEILKESKRNFHILRIEEGKDVNEWIQINPKSLEDAVNKIFRRLK